MKNSELTAKLYWKLLPVQIFSCFILSVNSLVDGLFVGRCIGTDAMAVIGLFNPVMIIFSALAYVTMSGAQLLCCRAVGRGDAQQGRQIFASGFFCLAGVGAFSSLVLFLFRMPMAAILGASGAIQESLAAYALGILPGVVAELLSIYLMAFLQINGKDRHSYAGLAVTVTANVVLDAVFTGALGMGILGIGLSTSLSYLLSLLPMLPPFFEKESTIRVVTKGISARYLYEIGKAGLPAVMFNVGIFLKSYIMNRALLIYGSVAAVSVLTMQGVLCGLTGAVPFGVGATTLLLASVYIGEEDRTSLRQLFRISLRAGIGLTGIVVIGILLLSHFIIGLFGITAEPAWSLALHMLWIFPFFLPLNAVVSILLKLYQSVGKITFVNLMTVAESALPAVFAVMFLPIMGIDAAWYAFPLSELFCIAVIVCYGLIGLDTGREKLFAFLKLPQDFGVSASDRLELNVRSMAETMELSEKVVDFCDSHGIEKRRSMVAGLAIEEMAGNIVTHGFSGKKGELIRIFVVYKKGMLTLRIRDNCRRFDPKQQIQLFHPESPEEGMGIRMIAGMSKEMEYQNSFGLNVLTIKI